MPRHSQRLKASYATTAQKSDKKQRTNYDQDMIADQHQHDSATLITDVDMQEDDDTTIACGSSGKDKPLLTIRCDIKLTFIPGNNPEQKCISVLKELFNQGRIIDPSLVIMPWYDKVFPGINILRRPNDIPTDSNKWSSYFPKLFVPFNNLKTSVYFKINLGLNIAFPQFTKDLGGWLRRGEHGLYKCNLQLERTKVVGWFENTYMSTDTDALAKLLKHTIGQEVGLRHHNIFVATNDMRQPNSKKAKAHHVELDANTAQEGLRKLSDLYGKSMSTLADGRKLRFFPVWDEVKSEKAKAMLKKAYERQKVFQEVVRKGYCSDMLHLDEIPTGSKAPTMRKMIMDIKSINYPDKALFLDVSETWKKHKFRGDYTFLFFQHVETEATLMMNNLIPYLHNTYGDDVFKYFTDQAKDYAKDDKWDNDKNRIISPTDANIENEDDEDLLGLNEAMAYKETLTQEISPTNQTTSPTVRRPDPLSHAQSILDARLKEVDTSPNLPSTAEKAYFDDDSISTLGNTTVNPYTNTPTQYISPTKPSQTGDHFNTPTKRIDYSARSTTPGTDHQRFISGSNSDTTSIVSTMTMESVQLMIDNRIGGLESMMQEILNKVNVRQTDKSDSPSVTSTTGRSSKTTGLSS